MDKLCFSQWNTVKETNGLSVHRKTKRALQSAPLKILLAKCKKTLARWRGHSFLEEVKLETEKIKWLPRKEGKET